MLFFFYGTDAFTASKKIANIREKFIREVDPSGANVTRFDGADMTVGDIAGSVAAMPLFVRKRLIIITNVFASRKGEVYPWLIAHAEKTPDSTILVLHEAESGKELTKSLKGDKAALFEVLKKQKFAEELPALSGAALAKHYHALAKENNVNFAHDALDFLIAEVGGDLYRAEQEIKKCAAYAHGKELDLTALREIIATAEVTDFFGFLDAVASRNSKAALIELEKQFNDGADAIPIILRLASQTRLMLNVVDHVAKRTPAAALARSLGAHPFVIEKAMRAVRHWKKGELISFHRSLFLADIAIKTSAGEPRAVLTRLLANLTPASSTSSRT